MHNQKFADNLKTEMANNHISQEKLAEMLNTSQAGWEPPNVPSLWKLKTE